MDYVPSGKMGLLILTHAGQLAYISRQAQYLLWQANHDTALPDQPRPFTDRIDLPPALLQLCRRLDRNRQTLDKPLMCSHTSTSGRFVFRACSLQAPTASSDLDCIDHAPDDGALIGLIIEYQELRRSKIERRIQGSGLSQQEQKICLALADDLTQTAIAVQLAISPHTVVTHIRRIYTKLGVHNRRELFKTLLAEPAQPQKS